jgi:hypothetical protein
VADAPRVAAVPALGLHGRQRLAAGKALLCLGLVWAIRRAVGLPRRRRAALSKLGTLSGPCCPLTGCAAQDRQGKLH